MGFGYFLTAILIEAASFMVPLALVAALLCKNMKMALVVAVAFGLVGGMETHIRLVFEFSRNPAAVWIHTLAKFIDLMLIVLVAQAIKDVVTKCIIKQAIQTGEENYTRMRLIISGAGLIIGIGLYFVLPVLGVGIILGSFFKRPAFGIIAGAVWTIFYTFVLYFIFMADAHVRTKTGVGYGLWLPWDSVILGLLVPPLTIYAKIALAKKLAALSIHIPMFK